MFYHLSGSPVAGFIASLRRTKSLKLGVIFLFLLYYMPHSMAATCPVNIKASSSGWETDSFDFSSMQELIIATKFRNDSDFVMEFGNYAPESWTNPGIKSVTPYYYQYSQGGSVKPGEEFYLRLHYKYLADFSSENSLTFRPKNNKNGTVTPASVTLLDHSIGCTFNYPTIDEIRVRSLQTSISGSQFTTYWDYLFNYEEDKLDSIHVVTRDEDWPDDKLVGSHYFKYEENSHGNEQLKAILLYNQSLGVIESDDTISSQYTLEHAVQNTLYTNAPKWIMVVAERDAAARPTVVHKYMLGGSSALTTMQQNIRDEKELFDGVTYAHSSFGIPIGSYVLTYKDESSRKIDSIRTYRAGESNCPTCVAPDIVDPIPGTYIPSYTYDYVYNSDGSYNITYNWHNQDVNAETKVPFYKQDMSPSLEGGHDVLRMDSGVNAYALADSPENFPLWEYHYKKKQHQSHIINEDMSLLQLIFLGVGSPLELKTDMSLGATISASTSRSNRNNSSAGMLNSLIDVIERSNPMLSGTVPGIIWGN